VTFQLVLKDDNVYVDVVKSNDVGVQGDLAVALLRPGIVRARLPVQGLR